MSSRLPYFFGEFADFWVLPYSRTTVATSPAPWWPGDRAAHEIDAGLVRKFGHQADCTRSLAASRALLEGLPKTGTEWPDMS